MRRKILRITILCFLLLLVFTGTAFAMVEKGNSCGENVTWELDEESGVLTISGEGPMKNDYTTNEYNRIFYLPPWWYQRWQIRSIVVEEGVTDIGQYAFYGCDQLTSVSLPDTLLTIQYGAFKGCECLPEIKFPAGLTKIIDAFDGCSSLKEVVFPDGIQWIGGFEDCDSLVSVTIPDSVETLAGYTFQDCDNLVTAKIGKGVDTLAGRVFAKCPKLRSVCLPDTIQEIEAYAFAGCDDLDDVYYAGTENQWDKIHISFSNRIVTEFGSDVNDALYYVRVHYGMYTPDTWVQYDRYSEIQIWTGDEEEPSSAMTYVYAKEPATAYSAAYDGNGQCLEIRSHELTAREVNFVSFELPEGTQSVKLFILDAESSPLCPCAGKMIETAEDE